MSLHNAIREKTKSDIVVKINLCLYYIASRQSGVKVAIRFINPSHKLYFIVGTTVTGTKAETVFILEVYRILFGPPIGSNATKQKTYLAKGSEDASCGSAE